MLHCTWGAASCTAQLPSQPAALSCAQPLCKTYDDPGCKGDKQLREWQLLLAELSRTHEAVQHVFKHQKVKHDNIDLTD